MDLRIRTANIDLGNAASFFYVFSAHWVHLGGSRSEGVEQFAAIESNPIYANLNVNGTGHPTPPAQL